MRIALTTLVVSAAILTAILIGSSDVCHAQVQSEINAELASLVDASPVPPDAVPETGTFFSAQNWPPMPYDWAPDLPVYSLGDGRFLIDDSSVNYSDTGAWGGTWPGGGAEGACSMDDSGPPSPPGDGGGTNSSGGGVSSNGRPFSTNGLWLQITGITNEIVSVALNNPTNEVYAIWSSTDLLTWNVETEVWPVTYQTWMPFTVEAQDRTNSLFLCAQDWTGVTSNGNETPCWWFWMYFGTTALSDTNLDVNGNTLLFDYTNGINPNITSLLVLTPSVTNGYAPLTVNFTLNASALPGTVQSVAWDWQGDGTPDLITSNLSGQSYTYSAGTYYPVVTVKTSQGTFLSGGGVSAVDANMEAAPLTIVVTNLPQIVWSQSVEYPVAVKANADGSVYVLSEEPQTLYLYSSNGSILRTLDLTDGGLSYPAVYGFDVDTNGNVYTAMYSDYQVMKWNPDSGSGFTLDTSFNNIGYIGNAGINGGNTNYQFEGPSDVAVSPDGTAIYVADYSEILMSGTNESAPNGRIQKFTSSGVFVLSIGGFAEPTGVKSDPTGRLFVADPRSGGVFSVVNDSIIDYFADPGALEASGDSMVLYVAACAYQNAVQQYDSYSYSYICSVPASIGLRNPYGVSIWPSQTEQRVYIADTGNNRVIGVTFSRIDPLVSWNAMTQAVANNNLPQALSYFSVWTSAKYGAEFQAVGLTNVSTILNQLPTPTLTEMTDYFAHYMITVQLNGMPVTFYINFANENGIWKISSF
jgi:hypothetical protein